MEVEMKKSIYHIEFKTEYKNKPAFYMLWGLIPFVGWIIYLVIAIRRQQFRGIWLNNFFLGLIYSLVYSIINAMGYGIINYIIITILSLAWIVFGFVILIDYVKNANYYSIKQRLEEGYEVINLEDPKVQQAVEKSRSLKIRFWQFTTY